MSPIEIEGIQKQNQLLEEEVERLRGIIVILKRGKFGSTSEKVTDLPLEQLIFNDIEIEAATLPVPGEMETITVTVQPDSTV